MLYASTNLPSKRSLAATLVSFSAYLFPSMGFTLFQRIWTQQIAVQLWQSLVCFGVEVTYEFSGSPAAKVVQLGHLTDAEMLLVA